MPTVQLAALCCWYFTVLVPIVLVMMQTGPPTSRHIIPCWYAMHVTEAVKPLVHQMWQLCQIFARWRLHTGIQTKPSGVTLIGNSADLDLIHSKITLFVYRVETS